jgi:hypothetical protein
MDAVPLARGRDGKAARPAAAIGGGPAAGRLRKRLGSPVIEKLPNLVTTHHQAASSESRRRIPRGRFEPFKIYEFITAKPSMSWILLATRIISRITFSAVVRTS